MCDDSIQIQTVNQSAGAFPLVVGFAGRMFAALGCEQALEPGGPLSAGRDVGRGQGLRQLHVSTDPIQIQQKNILYIRAGGGIAPSHPRKICSHRWNNRPYHSKEKPSSFLACE